MSFRGSQKAQYNKLVEALLAAREALEKALAENALLEARTSTAADKQILLLNSYYPILHWLPGGIILKSNAY